MIEPTDGASTSPVALVRKKSQSWRLCIDYRRLNAVIKKDAYPLPRKDESLDALLDRIFFSMLDLVSGYWKVPLDQEAKEQSAFVLQGRLWQCPTTWLCVSSCHTPKTDREGVGRPLMADVATQPEQCHHLL